MTTQNEGVWTPAVMDSEIQYAQMAAQYNASQQPLVETDEGRKPQVETKDQIDQIL